MPRHFKRRQRAPLAGSISMPIEAAMQRAARLLPCERTAFLEPAQLAFNAFRAGAGTVEHWALLADAMNVAIVLAHRQIASDHKGTFRSASEALRDAHDRHAAGGSWTLRGVEIAALELALRVHEVQLEHCSRGELEQSLQTVYNRVSAALAGNAAPGTHICNPGQPAATTPAGAAYHPEAACR